jgi:hypothetical protein
MFDVFEKLLKQKKPIANAEKGNIKGDISKKPTSKQTTNFKDKENKPIIVYDTMWWFRF